MTFEAIKDPSDTVDYTINWATTLSDTSPSDEISTSTWSADAGVDIASESETTTTATVWVSGGTLGRYANLVNRIVTTGGRTYERTILLKLQNT